MDWQDIRIPMEKMDMNLCLFRHLSKTQIVARLTFPRFLDPQRLDRAFRLLLQREPVLGSRLEMHPWRPLWRCLPPGEHQGVVMARTLQEYQDFRHHESPVGQGQQLYACLWQEGDFGNLTVVLYHEAGDAGALKDVLEGLASLYTTLGGDPSFTPARNLHGDRSLRQVFRQQPWYARLAVWRNYLRQAWRMSVPTGRCHAMPVTGRLDDPFDRTGLACEIWRLERDRVSALRRYGASRRATLNDLLCAAMLSAMATQGQWNGHDPLRLTMSVDLRRYLPGGRSQGICNLSGFEYLSIGDRLPASFDATVDMVAAITRERKQSFPGLNDFYTLQPILYLLGYNKTRNDFLRMARWAIETRHMPNVFTNMGPIDPHRLLFDGAAPDQAYFITPATAPPGFASGVTGYDGSLTLSATFAPGSMDACPPARLYGAMGRLLDSVI